MAMFRFYRQFRELKDQESKDLNQLQARCLDLQTQHKQELEDLQNLRDLQRQYLRQWIDVRPRPPEVLYEYFKRLWALQEEEIEEEREAQEAQEQQRTQNRQQEYERFLSMLTRDQDRRLQDALNALHQLRVERPLSLKNIICDNERYFTSQSPYLDALLVFAGLFSAILAAFLIEIRKGLQEDLLLQILNEMQRSNEPFRPTLVSIWVNGLWFPSLTLSMMGALLVMLAKSTGGQWVINEAEVEATFLTPTPEQMQKRAKQIRRIYGHMIFQWEVFSLLTTASIFLYAAVILFFAGLSVLLYTGLGGIGTSFLVIMLTMGTFFFGIVFHNLAAVFLCQQG